jgi:hypothetical protein
MYRGIYGQRGSFVGGFKEIPRCQTLQRRFYKRQHNNWAEYMSRSLNAYPNDSFADIAHSASIVYRSFPSGYPSNLMGIPDVIIKKGISNRDEFPIYLQPKENIILERPPLKPRIRY